MRVWEIMSQPVETVPPTMPAADAWELMSQRRLHHLIVKQGSAITGIISERDLGSRRGAVLRTASRVSDLMTSRVVTVDENDTVRRAANLMRGRSIGCLAVMRNGKLTGIVTAADMLGLLGHGRDRPTPAARPPLHYRVPHRKQHRGRSW